MKKGKHKPGKVPTKEIFRKPANPAMWKPTPFQMELYESVCRGVPFYEVAKKNGATTQLIRDLCAQIDEYLVERSIRDVRLMRVRHTFALDELFSMAMQSFELSKKPQVTEEDGTTDNGAFSKTKTVHREAGDAAFMTQARACLAEQREIWAANKKATTDPVDPNEVQNVGGTSLADAIQAEIHSLQAKLKSLEPESRE